MPINVLLLLSLLAFHSSCALKTRFPPNGPLGALNPENIKIYPQEEVLLPNHSIIKRGDAKPEYGGSKPWTYKNENMKETAEENKNEYSNISQTEGLKTLPSAPGQPAAAALMSTPFAFPFPSWLQQLINTAAGISAFIDGLGISGGPNVLSCTSSPTLKELMVCVKSAVNDGKDIFQTAQEIAVLNTRVMSGGRPADAALARLKTLASRPLGKKLMKALAGTTMMCTMLMQKELTPDRQRWQAGSIATMVTNLPVASDVTDTRSGGFGHVNVILPRPSRVHRNDAIIKQLNKGIDPADTMYGALGVEGRTDLRALK